MNQKGVDKGLQIGFIKLVLHKPTLKNKAE